MKTPHIPHINMHNRINTRLESKQPPNLKFNLLLLLDFLIL